MLPFFFTYLCFFKLFGLVFLVAFAHSEAHNSQLEHDPYESSLGSFMTCKINLSPIPNENNEMIIKKVYFSWNKRRGPNSNAHKVHHLLHGFLFRMCIIMIICVSREMGWWPEVVTETFSGLSSLKVWCIGEKSKQESEGKRKEQW